MAQKTINNIWAALSTNRVSFSEDEVGAGILYKGAVVSNQLNGIGYSLYDMLDFIQRTGGLYNSTKKYKNGDVVSILRKDLAGPIRVEQYRCIAQNEIVGTPPIMNAVYDDDARIPQFQGGQANKSAWARCDVVGAFVDTQERADFTNVECIKLFSTYEVAEIDAPSVKVGGEYNVVVYFEDKVTSFTIILEGTYTKTLDGSVIMPPNRLGIAAPEIYFKDVRTTITDYGNEGDFHAMMPFGIRFEYNNDVASSGGIYMRIRQGVRKISVSGSGTYITMNLGLAENLASNYVIIPIRSNGGFEAFDEIGTIESKDFHLPIEMQYKMGLYKLSADKSGHYPQGNSLPKDSPLWGPNKTTPVGLFSYLAKVKGSWQVPQFVGSFLRNVEENRIPGRPTNIPARVIGSFQNDAIRNITGSVIRGTGAGGGLVEAGDGCFGDTNDHIENGPSISPPSNFRIFGRIRFNAGRVVPTSHDNHPANIAVQFYYKAF